MSVDRPPSPRRPTLQRIADELGVSAKTVSNAYRHPDQLSAALRARILRTAERLGYPGPDPIARGLRLGRIQAIGILYDTPLAYAIDDAAAAAFLSGVAAVAEPAGYGLVLVPGSPGAGRDATTISAVAADGFIAYSVASDDPVLSAALAQRSPVVTVDQPRLPGIPWIGIDDEAAAEAAAQHLIVLGHARFGIVTFGLDHGPARGFLPPEARTTGRYDVTRRRLAGYERALHAAGIAWPAVPVFETAGSDAAAGQSAARSLLTEPPRPTAVLAVSDRLAVGILAAARDLGLTIPGDLSVIGFDDVAFAATTDPPLTTVHQPHREKGVLAGEALFTLLGGDLPPATPPLATRLVVRGSTGPPPAGS